MKRLLVTGARGFIGRNCLEPLARRGFDIHAVGRIDFPVPTGTTFHEFDVLDQNHRAELLEMIRPTHLLHAAWDLTVDDYMGSPHNYEWVAASLDLTYQFNRQGGRRAVYVGSCYEYRWGDEDLDERATPLEPRTHYGRAKASLYRLTRDLAEAAGFSMAWTRLFFLYGPHENPRRLVPSVITSLLAGQEAPTSHGMQLRDYMYSVDVGDAIAALLDSEVEGPVNVATGEPVRIADLVEVTAEICGSPELLRIGAIAGRPGEAPRVAGTTDRLRSEVGWNSYTPTREALEMTVEWWKQELAT